MANSAITDKTKEAFSPKAFDAAKASGAEDWESSAQFAKLTVATDVKTYRTVVTITAIIKARGIIFFGDFVFLNSVLQISKTIVSINLLLAIFNLVPIPPLDGSKVIYPFFSLRVRQQLAVLEREFRLFFSKYWIFILLFLFFFGFRILFILFSFIFPIVTTLFELFTGSPFAGLGF